MTARTIRMMGEPSLKEVSKEVGEVTPEILTLIDDMIDTMKANNGAGLAASQVGENVRVVTVDCTNLSEGNPFPRDDEDAILVLINPKLELSESRVRWREACLSIPGVSGVVERSDHAIVHFMDCGGNWQTIDVGWPLAGAVQHECDHLDGILYPDRMSRLTKGMLLKKFSRFKDKVEKSFRERLGIAENKKSSRSPKSMKAKKARKQKAKVARVSRRSSRSR